MKEVNSESRLQIRNRPEESVIMHQNWRDLLFLHWACDPSVIQATLPQGLFVDTFQGSAYIGIVPFFIENLHLPYFPPIPGLSSFLEVNVRTYVYNEEGIPGIWFYSLDFSSQLGAMLARKFFALPYFFAELEGSKDQEMVTLKGHRVGSPQPFMHFIYQPEEATYHAKPETLDFFLIERYALFSAHPDGLKIGRVHHFPYPLSKVNVSECQHNLLEMDSLPPCSSQPDHVLYSSGVNVDFFKLASV